MDHPMESRHVEDMQASQSDPSSYTGPSVGQLRMSDVQHQHGYGYHQGSYGYQEHGYNDHQGSYGHQEHEYNDRQGSYGYQPHVNHTPQDSHSHQHLRSNNRLGSYGHQHFGVDHRQGSHGARHYGRDYHEEAHNRQQRAYDSHHGSYGHQHPGHTSHRGSYGHQHLGDNSHRGSYGHQHPGDNSHRGSYGHQHPGHSSHRGSYGHQHPGDNSHRGSYGYQHPRHTSHHGSYGHQHPGHISHRGSYGHHGRSYFPRKTGRGRSNSKERMESPKDSDTHLIAPPPRVWIEAPGMIPHPLEDEGEKRLRVMSYNLLAPSIAQQHPELYRGVDGRNALPWETRLPRIVDEIATTAPSVIGFQEVEHFEQLDKALSKLGYQGIFARRDGKTFDGCATFWRTDRLELRESHPLHFSESGLRNNVALILVFNLLCTHHHRDEAVETGAMKDAATTNPPTPPNQPISEEEASLWEAVMASSRRGGAVNNRPPPEMLAVANTHILFNPKRGDIKLGQMRVLMHRLQVILRGKGASTINSGGSGHEGVEYDSSNFSANAAVVVLGDFNCVPDSPLYRFMAQGELDVYTCDPKRMSGTLSSPRRRSSEARGVGGSNTPPSASPASPASAGQWRFELLQAAVGEEAAEREDSLVRHNFQLKSVYKEVTGSEPEYTSYHESFYGTVDYIWYTSNLNAYRVLQPPTSDVLNGVPNTRVNMDRFARRTCKGLPTVYYPSDHISIVSEFVLEDSTSL